MIQIKSQGTWDIAGPEWVTNLPMSGSGNYDFIPVCSDNTTGDARQGEIEITYNGGSYDVNGTTITVDSETTTTDIIQYAERYLNGKVYILGLDSDEGYKVRYAIQSNGVLMDDERSACGDSIDISGYPQCGIVPVDGTDVDIFVYRKDETNEAKPFSGNMGNRVYYKLSDTPIESALDVISGGASDITMTYDIAEEYYAGQIAFSRSPTEEYFYIVIDVRNIMTCLDSTIDAELNGSFYPINARISYGDTSTGLADIEYTFDDADNSLEATYDGGTVAASDGLASASFTFRKSQVEEEYVDATITNPNGVITGNIVFDMACPALTSFAH